MGWGIETMTWAACKVTNIEGATVAVAAFSSLSLITIVSGGLWICIWRGTRRWWGGVAIVIGLYWAHDPAQPSILIGNDAKLVAVRNATGRLVIAPTTDHRRQRRSFVLSRWYDADGDRRPANERARKQTDPTKNQPSTGPPRQKASTQGGARAPRHDTDHPVAEERALAGAVHRNCNGRRQLQQAPRHRAADTRASDNRNRDIKVSERSATPLQTLLRSDTLPDHVAIWLMVERALVQLIQRAQHDALKYIEHALPAPTSGTSENLASAYKQPVRNQSRTPANKTFRCDPDGMHHPNWTSQNRAAAHPLQLSLTIANKPT